MKSACFQFSPACNFDLFATFSNDLLVIFMLLFVLHSVDEM